MMVPMDNNRIDAAAAWGIFQPELAAVTVDNWTDDDYDDEPARRQCALDIEAGNLTPDVLEEIENCLGRDWMTPRLRRAAWTVLAAHDRLEKFDPCSISTRRRRTVVLLGERWIIG
jgi:hypothetical protein